MPVTTRSRARQLRPNRKPVGFYAEQAVNEEIYEAAATLIALSTACPYRRSARLAQQQQQQRLSQPSV
jgi:hypothetical protein